MMKTLVKEIFPAAQMTMTPFSGILYKVNVCLLIYKPAVLEGVKTLISARDMSIFSLEEACTSHVVEQVVNPTVNVLVVKSAVIWSEAGTGRNMRATRAARDIT